jgi:hypothetical protein
MSSQPPAPPSRAALAAVLVQAAEAEPLLADQPVSAAGCTQRVDLANGWTLRIGWEPGQQMGPLFGALSPGGDYWTYGCDRWPDWNAGPDAVVLDPLTHLISPKQREQLRQRLLTCNCWPARELPPRPEPPSMAEINERFPFDLPS